MAHALMRRIPARPNTGNRSGGVSASKGFVAPIRGWIVDENQAAQAPGSARILDDCFPEETGVRPRFGSQVHADTETGEPVDCFLSYAGFPNQELFAVSDGEIWDVTSGTATSEVSGLTNGYFSYVNFATVGGHFLIAVNGADDLLLYDGSAWEPINDVSTPISITGVDTDTLIHVTSYKNRLYFTQAGSLAVYYLPVNSLGGEVETLSLAGVFKKGGAVMFCETWSVSVGDGMQDLFVVVSTEGEVAVYQGSYPDADDGSWFLVGRYEMPRPLSRNAYMRAEGDLVISTESGVIRLSTVFNADPALLAQTAVSRPIWTEWIRETQARMGQIFEVAKWPEKGMGLFTLPTVPSTPVPILFVVNLKTGAWARFTGWDAYRVHYHDGLVYFGTRDGRVILAEVGGADDGAAYFPTIVFNWDHLDAFGNQKVMTQARATYRGISEGDVLIGTMTNYQIKNIALPSVVADFTAPALWDVGEWDESVWDGGLDPQTYQTLWVSVGRRGTVFAPYFRTVCNNAVPPIQELVELTVRWETGRLVI